MSLETPNSDTPLLSSDRRARRLDRELSQLETAAHGIVRPAENASLAAGLLQQSFDSESRICVGRIIFAFPYAHWYRVQLDVGDGEIECCALSELGLQPLGIRNTSVIPPMTRVAVLQMHGLNHGVILGCLPRIMTEGAAINPDWISQGSGGGIHRERYYSQFPAYFTRAGDLVDFSSNRPLDTTCVGEFGRIDDLGGGLFMDPFMKWFRVDELCGTWMYYMDRLLRHCGYNYDFRSALSEQMIRNDNGEGLHYSGHTPYPWEANGSLTPDAIAHREVSDRDVHFDAPLGKLEPTFDDQQPFNRFEEFRDYLGQGYMRHVQIPRPSQGSDDRIFRYSQPQGGLGVFREQIFMHGEWNVTTAHSAHIMKRVIIPIPKRLLTPEDPTGDDLAKKSGYKFAGRYGDGATHHIADNPTAPTGSAPWMATALSDLLAYACNWKSLHAFHYHAKDFVTPQESDSAPFTALQVPLDFTKLQKDQWLAAPEPQTLDIDHRYKAKFYALLSAISLLPDGGVVIRGGAGCELRLAAGTAAITAPGDVLVQSGRQVLVYAGDDAIVKARSSIDLTASQKDVRIKAERNMDLLSANAGSGRFLIDCRAEGTTNDVINKQGEDVAQNGLLIKAANADLALLGGRNVYVRTGTGQIVLDAAQGDGAIQTTSSQFINYVQSSFTVSVRGSSPSVHVLGTNSQIDSSLVVKGVMFGQSGLQVRGNITAVDGQPGQSNAGDPGHQQNVQTHVRIDQNLSKAQQQLRKNYDDNLAGVWYSDQAIGNDRILQNTQYAPRTDQQMNADGFQLPETYWQQLAQTGLPVWEETTITYQGLEMMPHPGLKNWQTKKAFLKAKLNLHDAASGLDKARGDVYEDLAVGSFEATVMADNYSVVGDA